MNTFSNVVNYSEQFEQLNAYWSPITVVETQSHKMHIVLALGEFIWHTHADTDKTFVVIDGQLKIDFRDGNLLLNTGELFTIPKGIETKPSSDVITKLLIIEPVIK